MKRFLKELFCSHDEWLRTKGGNSICCGCGKVK